MTDRLGRLLRGQQDFVADASHQLRTPLTGIRLQLEELRDELPPDDPRVAELDAGIREVDRLAGIVNELLILSRAGEREMPAELVDLATLWSGGGALAPRRGHACLTPRDRPAGELRLARSTSTVLDVLVENAVLYYRGGSTVMIVPARRSTSLTRGRASTPARRRSSSGSIGAAPAAGPRDGARPPIARELTPHPGAARSRSPIVRAAASCCHGDAR